MPELISRNIEQDEILVRFIFTSDFKKGIIDHEKLIDKDVYFDSRGGVSLQRERYSSENTCKEIAKKNVNGYVGFLLFRKSTFDQLVIDHQKLRNEFLADVIATPLDENLEIINEGIDVYSDTLSNPAHSDLIYINPATIVTDESTHTFKRVFSKNLYKNSILLIDSNPEVKEYNDNVFKEVI